MKVIVACEESQAVCIAFREQGHEAYSCDLQDCSGGHPEWHIKGDALETGDMERHISGGGGKVAVIVTAAVALAGFVAFVARRLRQLFSLRFAAYNVKCGQIKSCVLGYTV